MRNVKLLALILLMIVLAACGSDENNEETEQYELTENEKISLNLDREQYQIDDVFDLANELEPMEEETLSDGTVIEHYEPSEFITFTIPGSGVVDVTRTISEGDDKEELIAVSILYNLENHEVIVDYYNNDRIRKSIFNKRTGFIIVNDNDEEYSKFPLSDLQ